MGVATNCDADLVGVPEKYLPAFRKLKVLRRRTDKNSYPYWRCDCPADCGCKEFAMIFTATGDLYAGCPWGCDHQQIVNAVGANTLPMPPEVRTLFRFDLARKALQPKLVSNPNRFDFIDSAAFAAGDFRPTWLVKKVLVKGEPAGIGGPMKSLKTSIAVDMAISLATGAPFLCHFDVPQPIRTAIISGESGRSTLQMTANRVCESKGISLGGIGENLHWCFDVPCLSDAPGMTFFVERLAARKCEVAYLDPLYLMLGDVNAASMFEAGSLLRNVATQLLANGITPVILHHARKALKYGDPMELADLSHSGFAEFLRQFVLINRISGLTAYGHNELIVKIGGSAGHSGEYRVEVDEGQLNADDFTGRKWDVTVLDMTGISGKPEVDRETKAADKVRGKIAEENNKVLNFIDCERADGQEAATKNRIKVATGWQSARLTEVIIRLLEAGEIEEHWWKKRTGKNATLDVKGYRRPAPVEQIILPFGDHPVNATLPGDPPGCPGDPRSEVGTPGKEHPGEYPPIEGGTPGLPGDPDRVMISDADGPKPKTRTRNKSYRVIDDTGNTPAPVSTKKPKARKKRRAKG